MPPSQPHETPGYYHVHDEKAFICHRCAETRLRRSAWLLLFTWIPWAC
jgi:hypothetical protein